MELRIKVQYHACALTLSCLVPTLYPHLTLSVYIFTNNGPMNMIPNSKMFNYDNLCAGYALCPLNHDNWIIIGDGIVSIYTSGGRAGLSKIMHAYHILPPSSLHIQFPDRWHTPVMMSYISVVLKHCTIVPLCHCAFVPFYHCAIAPLYHCAIVHLYHCAIVPLYHCAIVPSCNCAIVPSCPSYHLVPSCHLVP